MPEDLYVCSKICHQEGFVRKITEHSNAIESATLKNSALVD